MMHVHEKWDTCWMLSGLYKCTASSEAAVLEASSGAVLAPKKQ